MPQPTHEARREGLVRHGVLPHVDAHLAVGRAVAAGDAHVLLHGDPEPPDLLDEPEERGHGAAETAPDARAHERVETHAEDPREHRPDREPVPLLHAEREGGEGRVLAAHRPVDPDDRGRGERDEQDRVDRDLLDRPRPRRLLRQVAERLPRRVGEAAAAADPRAVEALAEEEREQRKRDERAREAPEDDQERVLEDDRRVEVLDLERPEVGEVVLLVAEDLQHDRQEEREHDLHRDDAQRPHAVVRAVAVPPQEEEPARDDRERVDGAVEDPLALERLRQAEARAERFRHRLEQVEAQADRGDRAEVENDVGREEQGGEDPGDPPAAAHVVLVRVEEPRLHQSAPTADGSGLPGCPPGAADDDARRLTSPLPPARPRGSAATAPRRTAPRRGERAPSRGSGALRSSRRRARGSTASRAC